MSHQVSCQSSSSELANRERFPTHFQVIASELNIAFGFYGTVRQFRWQRVSMIVLNENIFTLVSQLVALVINPLVSRSILAFLEEKNTTKINTV